MLEKLHSIGLSEREAKVYATLLKKTNYTAAELQEIVDIPRTKIYEVLTKMINRGICFEKKIGRNKYYIAVEPKIVFEQFYEQERTELEYKKEVMTKLSDFFNPIFQKGRETCDPTDYIEILKDKNLIHHKYTSLLRSSKKELLTFNKGPYSCDNPEKVREQNIYEINFLKRGGKSRGIYMVNEVENLEWLIEGSKELVKAGHQARMLPTLPIKMIVFDDIAVMFALNEGHDESKLTMISIEHVAIANACKILFEHLWSQACDFKKMSALKKK
ncbi:MAG TPA: helix-turn-helix domain-containing protein [Ignavibacteriaceae bacterium]|nr:helix-turn-helix domain-containing protein [Ignavibacteriaceae bacterium]